MAITSKEINLTQLDAELGGKGLIASLDDEAKKLILPAEGSDVTEAELKAAIAAHVPIVEVITSEEKLFNATGLTVAEYKALGL